SHGFLIVPLALYFVWERREKLRNIPVAPSALGLIVVAGSVAVLIAGILGSELFLTRISILGTLIGVILFLFGWSHLRALAFPVAIVTNGFRVAGTGIAAHRFGAAAAEGFFHEFSGWLVFVSAFMLMLAVQRAIVRLAPARDNALTHAAV